MWLTQSSTLSLHWYTYHWWKVKSSTSSGMGQCVFYRLHPDLLMIICCSKFMCSSTPSERDTIFSIWHLFCKMIPRILSTFHRNITNQVITSKVPTPLLKNKRSNDQFSTSNSKFDVKHDFLSYIFYNSYKLMIKIVSTDIQVSLELTTEWFYNTNNNEWF